MSVWKVLPEHTIKRDVSTVIIEGLKVHTDIIYSPMSIRRLEYKGTWYFCVPDIEQFIEKSLPIEEHVIDYPEAGGAYTDRDTIMGALYDVQADNYQMVVLGHYLNGETL